MQQHSRAYLHRQGVTRVAFGTHRYHAKLSKGPHMLNNHEANLTDEEAAAEVARVAKTYPVVRLLSADQIRRYYTVYSDETA